VENQSILHDKKVVNTMRKVSKLGIYLPGIFLILAIIVVFTAPKKNPQQMQAQLRRLTPIVTPTPTKAISINLRGPFVCQYTSSTATISASIKNKQVAADFVEATQESHFIVRDNCIYQWGTARQIGAKECGLGTAIDTLDFLSNMGILDFGSLLEMMPNSHDMDNMQKQLANKADSSDMQKFLETCVKKEPNQSVFTIPTDRVFVEPTTPPTPKQ
jgi:hypothetical protein